MSQTIENLEFSQCVKSATHFGKTVYHNLCTGTVNEVPWGGVDWLGCIGGIAFLACVALVIVAVGVAIVMDW
jgi:hypothetical protein